MRELSAATQEEGASVGSGGNSPVAAPVSLNTRVHAGEKPVCETAWEGLQRGAHAWLARAGPQLKGLVCAATWEKLQPDLLARSASES